MKAPPGVASAVLLLIVAARASAQTPDAYVLAPGQLRLSGGGAYESYDSRFSASGSVPLGEALSQPLVAASFAPLAGLEGRLTDFWVASGASSPPDLSSLTLGTPRVLLGESAARVPLGLALGVLPRVELGGRLWLVQNERLLQGLTLTGGTVGENPDPAGNAALLAPFGAEAEALGGFLLLPTAGSVAAEVLQARVSALTGGGTLSLPEAAADTALLQELLRSDYGVDLRSGRGEWRPAAAEASAKVLLLSSFGTAPTPPDSSAAAHYRIAATARLRLPVGDGPDSVEIAPREDRIRRAGAGAALIGDLFAGRFWATVRLAATRSGGTSTLRRLSPLEAPLASADVAEVTVRPGDVVELTVAPRVRLASELSLGVDYSLAMVGETRVESASVGAEPAPLTLDAGTAQRLGLSLRYSMLPDWWAGGFRVPAEVELRIARLLSGPEGWPEARSASVTVRLYPRLWGGRPTGAPPPPPPPAAPPEPPTGR
jgi:hypothetical protein